MKKERSTFLSEDYLEDYEGRDASAQRPIPAGCF